MSSHHQKSFSLLGIIDQLVCFWVELDFIKFLLLSSPLLERMTVEPPSVDGFSKLVKELLLFKRDSKNAEVRVAAAQKSSLQKLLSLYVMYMSVCWDMFWHWLINCCVKIFVNFLQKHVRSEQNLSNEFWNLEELIPMFNLRECLHFNHHFPCSALGKERTIYKFHWLIFLAQYVTNPSI